MKDSARIFIASFSVFVGSLVSDVVFGDGIQSDGIQQAVLVAVIAAVVQKYLIIGRAR